jgi:precorrin-3B methylase
MDEPVVKSFALDDQDKTVAEIVSKLKFFAKIDKDHVVSIYNMSMSEDSWYTTFKRTILHRHESRKNTLKHIRIVVDEGINIVMKCFTSKQLFHIDIGKIVIDAIIEVKLGISQLTEREKYKHDKMFISEVETFLELINAKIDRLKKLFPQHFGLPIPAPVPQTY